MLTSHNQVTQVTSPAHWGSVKTALVKSIRQGVLFDRKYWVRHSKSGDTLKPVYFSSTIMSDKVEQLKDRTSEFDCESAEALTLFSGEIPQGSKNSDKLPRGRRKRRQ